MPVDVSPGPKLGPHCSLARNLAGHVRSTRSLAFSLLPGLNLTEGGPCHGSLLYMFAPVDSLLGKEQGLRKCQERQL